MVEEERAEREAIEKEEQRRLEAEAHRRAVAAEKKLRQEEQEEADRAKKLEEERRWWVPFLTLMTYVAHGCYCQLTRNFIHFALDSQGC